MRSVRDAEIVASYLEHQAREVRRGFIRGFDLKWREGDRMVEGVNYIVPDKPAEFITLNLPRLQDTEK